MSVQESTEVHAHWDYSIEKKSLASLMTIDEFNVKNLAKTSFKSTTAAFKTHTESQKLPSTKYLWNIAQTFFN